MNDAVRHTAAAARVAAARLAPWIRETPLRRSARLSERCGADVYLKLENLQITGSFKVRGALNCLLMRDPARRRGAVAASSGNHGAALAWALRQLGADGVIFVPKGTADAKVAAIRRYGGEVRFHGSDGLETEQHARAFAARRGGFYVSPYNDADVIAGQGSCGVELLDRLPDIDTLFVAVGGGGLLSGVGSVLRAANPGMRIVACQPAASDVMARSVAAGRILDLPSEPTLSDGTAGGVEADSITFGLCASLADTFVTVDEAAIAAAMRDVARTSGMLVEGAAGVALAALAARPDLARGRKVAVIVCGGNVGRDVRGRVFGGG